MKIKRTLSLLLGIVMLSGALASCGEKPAQNTPDETTTADATETTPQESETTEPDNNTPTPVKDKYIPDYTVSQSWKYSPGMDDGSHVLLVSTIKSKSFFDNAFGSYPLNDFWSGDDTHKKAIPSTNDPAFLTRFRGCLYDYTYHCIVISYPNVNYEEREDYLDGLRQMLEMCKTMQPTAKVVYVNTNMENEETDSKALLEEYGYEYWHMYRGKLKDFKSQFNKLYSSFPCEPRTEEQMPEGSIPQDMLSTVKEGMYWEITELFQPYKTDTDLPRVLLIGDSITYGYRKDVRARMDGKALVDVYAISYAIADPALLRNLKPILERYDYDCIHINVAFHNCPLDRAEGKYGEYLTELLTAIQELEPNAKVVFATGTTSSDKNENGEWVFNAETYGLWKDRRDEAVAVCEKLGITVDDLYTLCLEINPAKADNLHFADNTGLADQVCKYLNEAIAEKAK